MGYANRFVELVELMIHVFIQSKPTIISSCENEWSPCC